MSDRLSQARSQLLDRLTVVSRRRDAIRGHERHEDGRNEVDGNDRAQVIQNDEVVGELGVEAAREVLEIRSALMRIDDGSWGICQGCKDPIPAARMLAMPTAALCIACATSAAS